LHQSFVKFYLPLRRILDYNNHFSLKIIGLDQIEKIRLNYIIDIAVKCKQRKMIFSSQIVTVEWYQSYLLKQFLFHFWSFNIHNPISIVWPTTLWLRDCVICPTAENHGPYADATLNLSKKVLMVFFKDH